jgi:hypothetical protein
MIILEHTAGQGTSLAATFEQMAYILARAKDHRRLGVCLDTCHLLASGYDIASPEGYAATFKQFDQLIGVDRLTLFHLNDSKRPLGSRVDRHEHIGHGCVGLGAFRRIVNDRRFEGLPMLLETPKEEGRSPSKIEIDRFDDRNLNVLRGLVAENRAGTAGGAGYGPSFIHFPCVHCVLRGERTLPNTSAQTATPLAPCFHASRGRPAFRQVCARRCPGPIAILSPPAAAAVRCQLRSTSRP